MHLMYVYIMCLHNASTFGAFIKPRCTCAASAYVSSVCVCVCVCLCVCYSNICSTAAFWLKVSVFGNNIVFSSLKAFYSKAMAKELLFCCAGTIGPTTTGGPF